MIKMKKYIIKTSLISNIYAINKYLRELNVEADVKQGTYVVDINSILGLLALDWGIGVVINFVTDTEDNRKLIEFLTELEDIEVKEFNDKM